MKSFLNESKQHYDMSRIYLKQQKPNFTFFRKIEDNLLKIS